LNKLFNNKKVRLLALIMVIVFAASMITGVGFTIFSELNSKPPVETTK